MADTNVDLAEFGRQQQQHQQQEQQQQQQLERGTEVEVFSVSTGIWLLGKVVCPEHPDKDELTIERMAASLAFGPWAFGPLLRSAVVSASTGDSRLRSEVPHIVTASVPSAAWMRGERGSKLVVQMLSDTCEQGLFMHGAPTSPVNSEVIPAIRHIFSELSALPPMHPKRVNCLRALTEACQDCQQV
eukprot:CAMPEP_0203937248 /NCGR_PEP_ID=MMETSP0359-20131031/74558_1 /ASSEMBLY_ACC=CAM_ASM_000338 /TAXON_ID=268821 /ORGANISM="Scrippsiella Hangoei, Strain SHTV-5" /LENGTH=186 /DNA_ID=CAMNT_0050867303 /DNA_START=56 /DNA_END=614 /DNA_ORIENTATION=+